MQAYAALLNAALKCGEGSLAVDVYRQMKGQGMPLPHRLFHTLIDVLVKIGKWQVSFVFQTSNLLHHLSLASSWPGVTKSLCNLLKLVIWLGAS